MDDLLTSSEASLPASPDQPDFQYERAEWVLFRSVNTLPQKAGVPADKLRRLVLKELADNALDAGGSVRVGRMDEVGDRFFVEDIGPGIDPDRVGLLFSINRPLISSKLWRLPSRGAMGNGLRVVTGSAVASGGSLEVWTRNKRLVLHPRDDGGTDVEMHETDFPIGTRVEIEFGDALPADGDALRWAATAAKMREGSSYAGRSSPFWYDGDAFYELLQAAGTRPVRGLVADLDGCSGGKAGRIAAAFRNRTCISMTRPEAVDLLGSARNEARPVRPDRLDVNGDTSSIPGAYECRRGEFEHGAREPAARLPFAIEAWVEPRPNRKPHRVLSTMLVNRTPITGDLWSWIGKDGLEMRGAGLAHEMPFPNGSFDITVNVTTPYCPITTDGKAPDLSPFVDVMAAALKKAAARARRNLPKAAPVERVTAKSVVLANLAEAVAKASGDGIYRFNQRQLFYVVRPAVMAVTGAELSYGNFEGIITDHEAEHGDIRLMYRDPRGTVYHPHLNRTIPLGTLAVEDYERPSWTFNKVLYIEKEGPFEALKAARWPERHDCALLTSKGYTTRAVKDLLDLLAAGSEPVTVFCIHDADASGTMIYQTLQEETRARPSRRAVEIVNLGLDPWEAVDMGLQVEGIEKRARADAVAQYLLERSDGEQWREWLRTQRVELNAMTTPDFIAWLDAKMDEHAGEKVRPPAPVLVDEMHDRVADHLRSAITARVLAAAGIDDQVRTALAGVEEPDGDRLRVELESWLEQNEDSIWRRFVDDLARRTAAERA